MQGKSFANLSVTGKIMFFVLLIMFVFLTTGTGFITSFVKKRITGNYITSIHTLFESLEQGVRDSLERGQMENFHKLLLRQRDITGVLDVTLYDQQGKANLSSSTNNLEGMVLDDKIFKNITEKKDVVEVISSGKIDIYAPQIVNSDCIRCHHNWKQGNVGGVLSLSYDLSELNLIVSDLTKKMTIGSIIILIAVSAIIYMLMKWTVSRPINAIIRDLVDSASQTSSSANQTSTASDSLASNAFQQAASIDETSVSIDEVSSMTANNAENASEANDLMLQAKNVMDSSNKAMQELIDAMKEISDTNEETYKIIKTIDEIAFQTNLLALNAAVEAARAGEAGSGFAVVADEVRSLAMRAASAAKVTSEMLEGTRKRVSKGVEFVNVTESAFKSALEITGKTAVLLNDISSASKEQHEGMDIVTKAVQELDKVTQQNAIDAEKAAEIARSMEQQSEMLNKHISTLVHLVEGGKKIDNLPVKTG
ncbi:MAG: methyl-accepting chemotaxis protein [Proteobacteria bacterium]|nr:methyl-accepting chemotaxis protein [Pseudomonadota bacterium]